MKENNKNEIIRIRLTSEEKDSLIKIYKEKGFSSASNFIRSLVFGKIIGENQQEQEKKDLRDLVYELNRIGNNFNQLVKLLHTRKVEYISEIELDLLKENIKNIGAVYAKIDESLSKELKK